MLRGSHPGFDQWDLEQGASLANNRVWFARVGETTHRYPDSIRHHCEEFSAPQRGVLPTY
ncbi:MAG: hypothetical protein HY080_07555 [Gammaproteobacteria bacterium]|nr:hypothetical protein [Gammaproteobacteria bacterium]